MKKKYLFDRRDYANVYHSFDGFKYLSEKPFSEQQKTLCDVLRSKDLSEALKTKPDNFEIVLEKIGGNIVGFCNKDEKQIYLDYSLFHGDLDCVRDYYLHELAHTIACYGHGTIFFIICCVLKSRYYKKPASEILAFSRVYDCQNMIFFDGSMYYEMGELFDKRELIRNIEKIDFSWLERVIDDWSKSGLSVEVIAHEVKKKSNIILYYI